MERQPLLVAIGGDCPEAALAEISAAAAHDLLAPEWGQRSDAAAILSSLRQAASDGEVAILCRDDAPASMVPSVSEVLRRHGVGHYLRWEHPDGGKDEYQLFDGGDARAVKAEPHLPALSVPGGPAPR